jgi:MFS family permease
LDTAAATGPGLFARPDYRYHLAGIAAFMVPAAMHMVLFPVLVTVELSETAARVGYAQMMNSLPMLLLVLVGGALADRFDQRRILIVVHLFAALPPLLLALWLRQGPPSYGLLLVYAAAVGTGSAFAQPARDALLSRIAPNDLQRAVLFAVLTQFGVQIIGYTLVGRGGALGTVNLLLIQAAIMASGSLWIAALSKAPPRTDAAAPGPLLGDILGGLQRVLAHRIMRTTLLLAVATGVFFGGAFQVLVPLLVRDFYGRAPSAFATVFGCFLVGTVTSTLVLGRRGGLARPGRGVIIALFCGAVLLLPTALPVPFWLFCTLVGLWGAGGGVVMAMTRVVMQTEAPPAYRARVLACFSLGTMGGMPVGSLFMGWTAAALGSRGAILVPTLAIALVALLAANRSDLWRYRASGARA